MQHQKNVQKGVNPIIMIGALFFVFGFITWLNSVLIPYLKIACELDNFESYLVAFSFYISYLVMAVPSGKLLKYTGYKKGMSIGLMVIALGALIFIPAALSRTYSVFLLGLFIQGTGLAILQTASNPYITVLGPAESAAKRISIMGICNKLAGALAPIVLGAVTLKNTDAIEQQLLNMSVIQKETILNELSTRVIIPYLLIVTALLLLAFWVYRSSLPEINTDEEDAQTSAANEGKKSILQFPHLIVGAIALFLYVGAEVIAGDTVISYGASQGIALSTAKYFTTTTLVSMIVGYLIGVICIPKYINQQQALSICALLGLVFSAAAIFTTGFLSVVFISLLGLANALIWPAIWPLAMAGLGRFTKDGASLLIMGIAGGAILPLLYGYLADVLNTQQAYIILIPCYLFIGYFGVYGYQLKSSHKKSL
ncbi:sugar MFS transporter [Pedobacter puniceum]|uniref:Glucose/galactose MFS transporter n=1 Tax=Pedobacter puniceum TaxID=2666136 RepID=A0A7K0FLN5_9SPHI|nr:sugar MFS transporter [Pedobacter puniceum]MRX46833.1 glucose/galactose MFS transporter [Pedobacter puniceum]